MNALFAKNTQFRTKSTVTFISLFKKRADYGRINKALSRVSELSGGLMRWLFIARALINTPNLLILEEPTTGLDPQTRHQIWDQLEKLKG